jgi:Polyphosphate kinase N-terminal domain
MTPPERTFLRDVYYDTPDASLDRRGIRCRLRYGADGVTRLRVTMVSDGEREPVVTTAEGEVPGGNLPAALAGPGEPARLLRSVVSPDALGPQLELEIERWTRAATAAWWRRARFALDYDVVTVRAAGLARSFQEITLRTLRRGRPSADAMAQAAGTVLALRTLPFSRRERGAQLAAALEREALTRGVGGGRWVALLALDGSHVATLAQGATHRLPTDEGAGEAACRHLLLQVLGTSVGDLRHLATTAGSGRVRALETWVCSHVDRGAHQGNGAAVEWLPLEEMLARAATARIDDAASLAALAEAGRSDLVSRLLSRPTAGSRDQPAREVAARSHARSGDGPLLDGVLSLLAFNARVLALAEDASVPLLERLRFLAIVSSNMDEFFSVQVGALKYEHADTGGTAMRRPSDRLTRVRQESRELVERQHDCEAACLGALDAHGVRIHTPASLDEGARGHLRQYFRSAVLPYLTPRAITATPGHSLPIVADRTLCFAVALRASSRRAGGAVGTAPLRAAHPRRRRGTARGGDPRGAAAGISRTARRTRASLPRDAIRRARPRRRAGRQPGAIDRRARGPAPPPADRADRA